MRKLFLLVISTLLLFTTDVYALSKEELKEKLTKEYTINGETFKLDNSYVAQLERYLSINEISEKDADFISSKIDEAVKIIEKSNSKSLNELTNSEKNKLKDIVTEISDKTNIKATIKKGGVITIYNTDGTVFSEISDVIKYTNDNTITIIFLVSFIASVSTIFYIKKRVFANV